MINNLDLRAQHISGKKVRPFTLNPNKPSKPAVRKRNKKDNAEFLLVETPEPGQWTLFVKGTKIPQGPQEFFLVISAGKGNKPYKVLTEGSFTLDTVKTFTKSASGEQNETSSFWPGDKLLFNITGQILSNADYGDYYGTVMIEFHVFDSDGELALKYKNSTNKLFPQPFSIWSFEYEIPENLPAGDYRVEATITMHNGATDKKTTTFTVQ